MPRFGDARGGYCMIGRCTDCLVVVDGLPNVPACRTPVSAGQAVRTQHGLGETAPGEAEERGR
jgi:aerobic-type carbon monoxide dehydrogenase small subunit (CoxS/CutS family)